MRLTLLKLQKILIDPPPATPKIKIISKFVNPQDNPLVKKISSSHVTVFKIPTDPPWSRDFWTIPKECAHSKFHGNYAFDYLFLTTSKQKSVETTLKCTSFV